jgi:hypothetical protein
LRYSGSDEPLASEWIGKTVRLNGKVVVLEHRPEIRVTDPQAIEVIE